VRPSGGRPTALAAVFALALLAGCGGSERAEKPAATQTATAPKTPTTGGHATSPSALRAQGYVVMPRTNVALRRPKGFELDESIPAFVRPGTRNSILVSQMLSRHEDPDQVIDEMIAGLKDKSKGAAQGLEFESGSASRSTAGRPSARRGRRSLAD
jgi:hypothetical protein